jgi:glycosyltransferase involved in cell wall biosynthesis
VRDRQKPQRHAPRAVLMIAPAFRPLVGGYERAAERLSASLADAGLRVVVITEHRDRSWPTIERIDGYEVRRLFCLFRRNLHTVTSMLSFTDFLLRRGGDFDIWHVHQSGSLAALAVVLGRLLRRPVVLKLTSSAEMGLEEAIGNGIRGRILGTLHRRVAACVALTEETRTEAIRFGIPRERVHIIPNGVDGQLFRPASPHERAAARRQLGLGCDRLVLSVGRLSPEKNPLGLLDAWAAVSRDARVGAVLVLVGDGPQSQRVRGKVATLGLDDVVLPGQQADVALWYRAADVCVVPSRVEGLCNSMLEAMASGVPVISTRVSGSSVLVEAPPAGLVVDVGSTRDLAHAMQSVLLDAELRARLGQNARQRFASHFSLTGVTQVTLSLYQGLLSR